MDDESGVVTPRASISISGRMSIFSPSSDDSRSVLVIFDVSREVSTSVLEWTASRIVQSGDVVTLLGILHEVLTPMGYKSRVDFGSFNGVNLKCLDEEAARVVSYYEMKAQKLQSVCCQPNVKFQVEVAKGHPLCATAVQEAKKRRPSWVILDKTLRRHSRKMVEQLSCNVIQMDRNNDGKFLKVCQSVVLYPCQNLRETTSDSHTDENSTLRSPMEGTGLCSVCQDQAPRLQKPPRSYTYSELEDATQSFSLSNFIAEGGYGPVYRGVLQDGQHIAVKQNRIGSTQGEKEFQAEIKALSGVQHRNLVSLLGYCIEGDMRMLVYEFVCNKSLDWHLSASAHVLPWSARHAIALGASKGLRYIHEGCRTGCIVHRDVRPHNILLTHDYRAKVGDFGLAKWSYDDSAMETRLVGSLGYLAPEYVNHGEVTTKADVYSFGVVLLELITGHKAIDPLFPQGETCLVEWARPKLEARDAESLVDKRLGDDFDTYELHAMVHAAAFCLRPEPSHRARMSQIVRILGED